MFMANSVPNSGGTDPFLLRGCDPALLDEQETQNHFNEKRRSPRLPFRGRAKAVVFPSPTSPANATIYDSEVMTSDLSAGGVSILCRQQLNAGQQLMLLLSDKMQL